MEQTLCKNIFLKNNCHKSEDQRFAVTDKRITSTLTNLLKYPVSTACSLFSKRGKFTPE